MSIRKRRRDRTRNRVANQKRLDAIAHNSIINDFMACCETWGASRCPECLKPLPARAFIRGGDIRLSESCIMTIGTSVHPQYCHQNQQRCMAESAKADRQAWKFSTLYAEMELNAMRSKQRDHIKAIAKENYEWRKRKNATSISSV